MRRRLALLLALLAGPVAAEPAGCPELAATLERVTGYRVTAPPAGPEAGWCVFDGAVLHASGAPDLAADRLRLRGETVEGMLAEGIRHFVECGPKPTLVNMVKRIAQAKGIEGVETFAATTPDEIAALAAK